MKVHMNTAGSGIIHASTHEVMSNYLSSEFQIGSYETELKNEFLLKNEVYNHCAQLINCDPKNVALFTSATDAWINIMRMLSVKEGTEIWTSDSEYAANIIYFSFLSKKYNLKLRKIPSNPDFTLNLEWMENNLSDNVSIVSITHIPSCCGIVNPIEKIGDILKNKDTTYIVDVCQSIGQLPVDVKRIQCDLLTGAGRKFLHGPRGVGFAFISEKLLRKLNYDFFDLHAGYIENFNSYLTVNTAKNVEKTERSLVSVCGFNNALKIRVNDSDYNNESFTFFFEELKKIKTIKVLFPDSTIQGIAAFQFEHCPASDAVKKLRDQGINLWEGTAQHTPFLAPHLLHSQFVRASFDKRLTIYDIEIALNAIRKI
ncbi:aminotransferase class V-fold PLP-dependent enzyme [Xenorhabdus miraniensis]|uniref:Putative aminotransferase n=1 Tax=Xenorhabdus miraniensis TaxID=351674 RepID=A0A2D0JRQ8_9GAMM|nr:aminotransferase class V-fold PLP-dependent enzyme [Xenorhabdus miraniensis]PHM48645.1 putative aminotransferase [Xenorhabdus miraniensis]PHM48978.1 putative aminotransferase [Xenorhabdus miraniensis]